MRPISVYDPKKGKEIIVGQYNPQTKTFVKHVNSGKHYLITKEGYAIQEVLMKGGWQSMEIVEDDTGNVYYSTKQDWKEKGEKWDAGHGKQIVLPLKEMKCVSFGQL